METATWFGERHKIAQAYGTETADAAEAIWAIIVANFADINNDTMVNITPGMILRALNANGWRIDKISPIE